MLLNIILVYFRYDVMPVTGLTVTGYIDTTMDFTYCSERYEHRHNYTVSKKTTQH